MTILSIIVNIATAVMIVIYWDSLKEIYLGLPNIKQNWWFFIQNGVPKLPFKTIIVEIMFVSVGSLIALLTLRLVYKKSILFEIFFLKVFILTISLQSIRIWQLFLRIHNTSYFSNTLVSKATLFFLLLAIGVLFVATFNFSYNKIQKKSQLFYFTILLSLSLAIITPLELDIIIPNTLVNSLVDIKYFSFFYISIQSLSILNLLPIQLRNDKKYGWIIVAYILFGIGTNLIYFFIPILFIPGLFLIIIGCVLYMKQIYKTNLWTN